MWIWKALIWLFVILIITLVIYRDTHTFVVRKYKVDSDKVRGSFTFAFISDLHGYVFGKDNEKLISAINEASPDAILCGGDLFTARPREYEPQLKRGEKLMTGLAAMYPVYMANGNHEHRIKSVTSDYGNAYSRYKETLCRAGCLYLDNSSADIPEKNIRISGLDADSKYYRKFVKTEMDENYLPSLLGNIKGDEREKYQILLAHNPQYFDSYREWGADLTLSGHVHGGIIRLPLLGGVISPAMNLFPRFDGGKYTKDQKTMILGRGLGTHTIHVRFLNPCELVIVEINGV